MLFVDKKCFRQIYQKCKAKNTTELNKRGTVEKNLYQIFEKFKQVILNSGQTFFGNKLGKQVDDYTDVHDTNKNMMGFLRYFTGSFLDHSYS